MEREVVAESRLDAVTVYASGALCRRRVPLAVPAARVRVTGLPLVADAGSFRARVVGAGVRVTDVRREVRAEPLAPERIAGLKQEVDAAEESYDAARARRDRLADRVDATASLRALPPTPRRGDPPRPAPVEAFLALAEFVDTRLAALHLRLLDAEDELTRAGHELDLARHRLAEATQALSTQTTRTTADAVITLAWDQRQGVEQGGVEQGGVELELEYVVPGATWFPSYQLRLDQAGASGALALRASVAQRTGEDWTGVRLSLSTADLQRRTALPELRSIRLGRRQEEAGPGPLWREPPVGTGGLFGAYDLARSEGGDLVGLIAGQEVTRGLSHGPLRRAAAMAYAASPDAVAGGAAALPVAASAPAAPAAASPAAMRGPGAAARSLAAPVPPGGPMPQPQAAFGAAPFAPSPAGPPVAPPPPVPDPALQDYAGLLLAGPDAAPAARGRLAPETASQGPEEEYRRRASALAGEALPPHAVPVGHASGSFAYRFDAAAPVDVPADGRWHSVAVDDFPVGLTPWHLCVPALDPAVYAAVELANTSPHALLAGPLDVLVDGEYTATVPLPALAPGQSRRVGIGVDEGVRVARTLRTSESSSGGLRGSSTVVAQTVEIEVANRLGRPISLELLERVPVSDDRDVRIEDAPADPPWTVVAPEEDEQLRRGLRRWRLVVEAGSTAKLTAGHQIRLPAGKAVVGGNRRDA